MSHTILLIQPGRRPETRTYSDYESVNECVEAICRIYETHLKKLNPNVPSISYDMTELFEFIDHLSDISCFVFQRNTMTYIPFNKMWIKQKIHDVLKRQANVQQQQQRVCTNYVGLQEAKIENDISGELLNEKKIIREIEQAAKRSGSKLWHLYYT